MQRSKIENVIKIALYGTEAAKDQLEAKWGMSLSSIIDECWDMAEDRGDTRLAARCERAFNKLTGR